MQTFLLNIKNYSPKVINVQQCNVELNIILLTANNLDIKQKASWNICHKNQGRPDKTKANKTH